MAEELPPPAYKEKALRMLYHKVYDYKEVAEEAQGRIEELRLPFGGDRWLSLKSVSHFNLGISLELMLKFLLAWEKRPVSRSHLLAGLYTDLSSRARARIQRGYSTLALNNMALQAFALGVEAPGSPKPRKLETVNDFFEYFDEDVWMWGKRYEWEKMNTEQWRHYMSDIRPFAGLVDEVMRGFFRL